jgi:beta-lactamase superfamily II metal-dependent hydrolase
MSLSANSIKLIFLCIIFFMHESFALPTNYITFNRTQSFSHQPDEDKLVRIWMFYVGQGDSILIQIPESLTGLDETYDVLIDAGPNNKLAQAIKKLYPQKTVIESFVVSHHDNDHVAGLTHLVKNKDLSIEHVWHNGLVSFMPKAFDLSSEKLSSKNLIAKKSNKVVQRYMGLVNPGNSNFEDAYLVDNKAEFERWYKKGWFHDVYKNLAKNLLSEDSRKSILSFDRAFDKSDFIEVSNPKIKFIPLWPRKTPKRYGDWGETINGNSVSFMFTYGDFEMFFTGDLNEKSEKDLLAYYKENGREAELKADVLKVPHHGSRHNDEDFFKKVSPVLGVASMGKRGFETNWKHPSEDVVSYLGGSHKLYSTYVHEKRFKYEKLNKSFYKMRELKHVLIETDGDWFRIVEIPVDSELDEIPSVSEVKTGNGTQWVSAKEKS